MNHIAPEIERMFKEAVNARESMTGRSQDMNAFATGILPYATPILPVATPVMREAER